MVLMKIYYWSPHLSNKVATVKAVLNSCKSLNNKKGFDAKIINVIGEWDEIDKKYRVDLIKKIKIYKYLPKQGFFYSRFSSIIIFVLSFFPLYFFIKKNKPNFLIVHLLTSIPIILSNFFRLETKIILRISGFPRLNSFRKFIWKNLGKKISFITTPTIETKKKLQKEKIFKAKKLFLLRDPILRKIKIFTKNFKNFERRQKFLAIGRLSKQKNFEFLINAFEKILKKNKNFQLKIVGEGEERHNLQNLINNKNIQKKIKLIGYRKNIEKYFKESDCFILTSLWEDPGFVLVEAGNNFIPIISSDCESGPKEISNYGKNMFLFKSNDQLDFFKVFQKFLSTKNHILKKKCIQLNKNLYQFSIDSHSKILSEYLLNEKKN